MGGDLGSSSPFKIEDQEMSRGFSFTETFEKVFPYYLFLGMTYEQFWESDCSLVKAYRKVEEYKAERKNQELWLQGAYVYDAILRIVPIIMAFGGKDAKPRPYVEKPYAISQKEAAKEEERIKREKYEQNLQRTKEFFLRNSD